MIYFVGIHHKPGLPALCSTTPSGKKIDAVIARLNVPCEKINLFSTDHIPRPLFRKRAMRPLYDLVPPDGCTIVLLGGAVQKYFPFDDFAQCRIIRFRHPGFSLPSFVGDLVNLLTAAQ